MRKLPQSQALQKAYPFSVEVVKFCRRLMREAHEYEIGRQLLRSATSIAANIAEAKGGISRRDFAAKINISYKESLETKYWLNLLYDLELMPKDQFEAWLDTCDQLSAMLYATLRKTSIQPSGTDQVKDDGEETYETRNWDF